MDSQSQSSTQLKTILRGAAFAAAGLLLSKVFLYTIRLVTARLGTAEYGLFSIALLTANFAYLLAIIGVDQALLSYVSAYTRKPGKVRSVVASGFSISIPSSIAVGAALFFLAPFLAQSVFREPAVEPLLQLIAVSVPFTVFAMASAAVFRSLGSIDVEVGVRSLAENFLKLAFVALLVYAAGWGVFGATAGFALGAVATAFISAFFLLKMLPKKTLSVKSFSRKKILFFSVPLALSAVAYALIPWVASVALSVSRSASEVGLLSAAQPTGELMLLFPMVLFSMFVPAITHLVVLKKRGAVQDTFSHVSKWVLIASLPLALLLAFFAKPVLTTLFGGEYNIGATALAIIVGGYFIFSLFLPAILLLQVLQKPKKIFLSVMAGLAVCIILSFTLSGAYGFEGAAAATALSMVAYGGIGALFAKKACGIKLFTRFHPRIAIAGVAALAAITQARNFFSGEPLAEMVVLTAVFAAVYVPLLFALRCFDYEDNDVMHALLRKIGVKNSYKSP